MAGKVLAAEMREKVTLNHPIFSRWPAQYSDRLQLFSPPTPNGVKVGIMLEETGLAYEPHRIDIMFAGKAYEDKRPRDRYATESARLLGVLDERLAGRDWVMGADYSIAYISLLGWVRNLIGFYKARELVGFDRFLHVQAWLNRGRARPAVQHGLEVTAG